MDTSPGAWASGSESERGGEHVFTVLFEPNELGGWTVTVPVLPGVVTECTLEEARRMAEEAIQLHLEGLLEDGEPIPEERFLQGRVKVRLPLPMKPQADKS